MSGLSVGSHSQDGLLVLIGRVFVLVVVILAVVGTVSTLVVVIGRVFVAGSVLIRTVVGAFVVIVASSDVLMVVGD